MRIKICGITRIEDAAAAVASGADAIGLIFYAGSRRAVTAEAARAIVASLPPLVPAVGVFVNEDLAVIRALKAEVGLAAVQLHGDETPADAARLPAPVIKAFRALPADLAAWPVAGYMADGAAPGHYGGTGVAAEDPLLAVLAPTGRMILAGGLTPETVAERVRRWRPAAVDVASGVESAPGIKDVAKIQAFVAAARGA